MEQLERVLPCKASFKRGFAKFLLLTGGGIFLFTFPVPGTGEGILVWLIHFVQHLLSPYYRFILLAYFGAALVLNLAGCLKKPLALTKSPDLKKTFVTGVMQPITLSISVIILAIDILAPEPLLFLRPLWANILDMCGGVFVFLILSRIFLPLISEFGLSEMLEVYLSPLMRRLFRVPGAALINILTCMFVSVTVSVVLVAEQFYRKVFTRKEAVIVICCLTMPSIPLTMLVLENLGISHLQGRFYIYLAIVSALVGMVAVRIPPLREEPKPQLEKSSRQPIRIVLKEGAVNAAEKALKTKFSPAHSLRQILLGMVSFIPYIISWGTIISLLLTYTPIIQWITYPYGLYLELLGISSGISLSPVIVLEFIDIIMPVVLLQTLSSTPEIVKVLCMTMGQMVYISPLLLADRKSHV